MDPDHAEQEFSGLLDNAVPSRGYKMLPMVGIGGSAGSIPALQTFFGRMPADSGMAFVVILHLLPEHESMLAELLQRCTTMPVFQVNATAKVEPGHVYVIPPGKVLAAMGNELQLAELPAGRGRHVAGRSVLPHARRHLWPARRGDRAVGCRQRRRHRHPPHQGARRADDRPGSRRGRALRDAPRGDRDRNGRLDPADVRRSRAA